MFRRNAISRESPVHQRQVGGLEPTVAREHVCGPDVISTATVNGAREISAGQSPLAKQVARAVRARRNHVGGVPANCGSVSPERSEPRSGRYAGCEQVGPSPRLPKPQHSLRFRAAVIHLTARHICRGKAGASEMRQGRIGSGAQCQKSFGAQRKARFSNTTAEEQIQAPYTWTKPLAPNCGAPSVRSAAAFATGRKSARSRRHVSARLTSSSSAASKDSAPSSGSWSRRTST